MQADLDNALTVPPEVMFPLELNLHLKETITRVTEEKWALIDKLQCEEIELKELQKYKEETKLILETLTSGSNALVSTKFIELSKKNRDMCWQNECMKSKMMKLMAETESCREKMKIYETNRALHSAATHSQALSGDAEAQNMINAKVDEEVSTLNQQLTKSTAKMMEYRRQNQLIQMELRTALRALAQEVGEGVTPKRVLKDISSNESSWRGRQQQIIMLQQKLSEAQIKISYQQQLEANQLQRLKQQSEAGSDYGDQCHTNVCEKAGGDCGNSCKGKCMSPIIPIQLASSASKRCLANLQQHDAKKRDKIDKLTEELDGTTSDLKSAKQEVKGFKARNQVLEDQIRSLRIELESVKLALSMKHEELKQSAEEAHKMRAKTMTIREQENQFRENTLAELKEANQSVTRERAVVVRLQQLLSEKQEALVKMDTNMEKLKDDLQVYAKNSYGSLEASQRIKNLETQLQYTTQSIQSAERERERLLCAITNSSLDIKRERRLHCETELLLVRACAVMKQADDCINTCLNSAHVTSMSTLQEVENLRSSIRQINARNENRYLSDEIQKSPRLASAASKEAAVLNDYIKKANRSLGRGMNHLNVSHSKRNTS